jgi:2-polyprenyl-3-methyl-5-hydroxy-6-metoxy-1,4-benzoquinol methylase
MEMYLRKCAALERRIVPGLTHSHYTYKKALHAYARPSAAWLDAGAGRGLFPDWLRREEAEVLAQARPMIGVDPDLASLRDNSSVSHRVVGMLECAPLRSESFDLITSNQVVEHVADPQGALSEIRRLLKPGGVFIFHTPNFLNYQTFIASLLPQGLKFWLASFLEGRHEKDVFPTHYRMNTPGTIQGLAQRTGFTIREIKVIPSQPELRKLGRPVLVIELLITRVLNWRMLRIFRSNIVAVLERA